MSSQHGLSNIDCCTSHVLTTGCSNYLPTWLKSSNKAIVQLLSEALARCSCDHDDVSAPRKLLHEPIGNHLAAFVVINVDDGCVSSVSRRRSDPELICNRN